MTILEVIRKSTSTEAQSTDKLDDLGLESLDIAELIKDLETAFTIEIENAEIAKLQTVEDVIALVNRLQNTNIVCG